MKLGFHVPYYHDAAFIEGLGEELLGSGLYEWIEIKYPHDIVDFDGASYEQAVRALVSRYDAGVSMHVPTYYDLGMWSIDVRRAAHRRRGPTERERPETHHRSAR